MNYDEIKQLQDLSLGWLSKAWRLNWVPFRQQRRRALIECADELEMLANREMDRLTAIRRGGPAKE